jgi:beta-glucanase (GH16 family)
MKGWQFMVIRGCFLSIVCGLISSLYAGGWQLNWSDEFDSTALNDNSWMVRVANRGWVNNEEQRYTSGHDNAASNIFVKNGYLILEARKSSTGEITSGRIEGMNKKSFRYGRMEARARMPRSQAYWPAIWMIGVGGGWPACGEIDIMEGKGQQINWTSSAFHSSLGTPTAWGNYTMPDSVVNRMGNVHDSFHIYALEWTTDSLRWYFDKKNVLTLTKAAKPGIPIDKDYYFILNVAVGGSFPGGSNSSTVFPESMVVDYVRVFKWNATLSAKQDNFLQAAPNALPYSIATGKSGIAISMKENVEFSIDVIDLMGRKTLLAKGNGSSFYLRANMVSAGAHLLRIQSRLGTRISWFAFTN